MNKKYIIRLSDDERSTCETVIKKLSGSSQKVRRAQMLLKVDVHGPSWIDSQVAEAFNCRTQTVENLRKRVVRDGFQQVLDGKKRALPPTLPKLDGEAEAKLIAMRLGSPPEGFGHWTLKLLAAQLVALEVVDSISPETVRQTLKKKDDETVG